MYSIINTWTRTHPRSFYLSPPLVCICLFFIIAFPKEWHRKCFKCKDCNKTLDSIIACDGPDHDVYCKTCYGKKWGPHGYGFACGSGFLQTDGLTLVMFLYWVLSSLVICNSNVIIILFYLFVFFYSEDQISATRPFYNPDTTSIKANAGEGCPRCGGKVFAAEQQLAKGTVSLLVDGRTLWFLSTIGLLWNTKWIDYSVILVYLTSF